MYNPFFIGIIGVVVTSDLLHPPIVAIPAVMSDTLTDSSKPTTRIPPLISGLVIIADSPKTVDARVRSSSASSLLLAPGISIITAPFTVFFIFVVFIPISFNGILFFNLVSASA